MQKYVVFFDIDGTLLTEDTYEIPDSAKKALDLARANGHYLFINTGRTFCALDEMVKNLSFHGYVCGCGTNLYFGGKEIMSREIPAQMCKQLVKDLEEYHIDGILEGKNNIYYRKKRLHNDVERIFASHQVRDNGDAYVGFWDDESVQFDKMALWMTKDSDFETFFEKYKEDFEFIHRDVDFYELVPKGYSKATGMQFIEEYLKIDHANSIGIGDSTNDLPMLEYAGISIVMGNANELVKKNASYVTTDIHDNGIYHALEHFNLI